MDKITERETHDFMNVESFSQLPFIRRTPTTIKERGIRLFGKEFGGGESESTETTTTNEVDSNNKDNNSTENNGGESNRRFECHYCCRNFPTSQALGGHQNAHKRERQHAKRAHLQSSMVHGGTFSEPHHHHHLYPLMNYRFTSAPTTPMSSYHPTWNHNNNSNNVNSSNNVITPSGGRFYGTSYSSHHHHHHRQQQQQQPINGSPLAFWRIPNSTVQSNPTFDHERSLQQQPHHPLPLFAGEEMNNVRASQVGASASQNRYLYDSKRTSVHDQVSLDLHL